MYLIDTNVISEARKGLRAHRGVRKFFEEARATDASLALSVVTVGELRSGVERSRARGDLPQAEQLERWLMDEVVPAFSERILPVTAEVAQVWGMLRARNPHHAIDKLIAATALLYDLTVVTRNTRDFAGTGVRVLDPFYGV